MQVIKTTDFFQIPRWIREEKNLSILESEIYSLIWGYSRDGEHVYYGSVRYLCDWTNSCRSAVMNALKKLTDEKYLLKKTWVENGMTRNEYRVNMEKVDFILNRINGKSGDVYETNGDVYETNGGCVRDTPNNINNNNTHINDINIIDTRESAHTSEKSSSSLLDVDRKPKKTTRKTQQDKSNAFIEDCSKLLREFKFAGAIEEKLMEFFTMLSEIGKLLPTTSIKAQLNVLSYLDIDQQKEIITTTITRGWSSLDYAKAEYDKKHHASFDTAQPGTFQPRIPGSKATEELEQKMRDSFNDPERRKKEWF